MKHILAKLFLLTLFFQNLLITSFTVSKKNPNAELAQQKKELTQKKFTALYDTINSKKHQIQWFTTTAIHQKKLIDTLKKSADFTPKKNNCIKKIEEEINSCLINSTSNNCENEQFEFITNQVKLQSKILDLLGYCPQKPTEENIQKKSSLDEEIKILTVIAKKQDFDINLFLQSFQDHFYQVVKLQKELAEVKKEITDPSKQNKYSQIYLLEKQTKLQEQLLKTLNS